MKTDIRNVPIPAVAAFCQQLPEFQEPYSELEMEARLAGKRALSLGAFVENQLVGFKLGYERDGQFYSWLGGVLPQFRRSGIGQALAAAQEAWALENGYASIMFKTRNRHKAMLIFALKNGFEITGFEERNPTEESRIWLRKELVGA